MRRRRDHEHPDPPGEYCDGDPATTGLALYEAGGQEAAVTRAVAYLKKAQREDGAFPGYTGSTTGSVHATGFAAQALRALDAPAAEARRLVGLVPQTPADLLYLESVEQELGQADSESADGDTSPGARRILDRLVPGIAGTTHPRDLSEGQKPALVLAIQLAATPRVLLLDEPTRGLDYRAKAELTRIVAAHAAEGRSVVISTHDVEFVAPHRRPGGRHGRG